MKRTFVLIGPTMFAFISAASAQHALMSDQELLTKLEGAAPQHVLEHATILNMGADCARGPLTRRSREGWWKEGAS